MAKEETWQERENRINALSSAEAGLEKERFRFRLLNSLSGIEPTVTLQLLESNIQHPAGSPEYVEEQLVFQELLTMCCGHGFPKIHTMVEQVYQAWVSGQNSAPPP